MEISRNDNKTSGIDGLAVSNSKNVMVLVKLAGGVNTSTESKLRSNTSKTYKNALEIFKKNKHEKIFIILHYGKQKYNTVEVQRNKLKY